MAEDILCIYHANCADGFGAAYAVWRAIGDDSDDITVAFHPTSYQQNPPNVEGKHVVIVDFSYKRDVLADMAQTARSILVIDHHKTAQEDLADLKPPKSTFVAHLAEHTGPAPCKPRAIFNMNYSGAVLTWNYMNPARAVPTLLLHVQDRDLWKFEMDCTKEISAALFSHAMDFHVWDAFVKFSTDFENLIVEGAGILRAQRQNVDMIAKKSFRCTIAGYDVPVVNANYCFASDLGHVLCAGEPFAAVFSTTDDGIQYSLRSDDSSPLCVDVSEIARQFGGGGHRNAAGFFIRRPGEQGQLVLDPADFQ